MAEVIWAPSALDDIDSIAEYIARDSIHRASLFVNLLIEKKSARRREFPGQGRPSKTNK